jgi:hypothetical protein
MAEYTPNVVLTAIDMAADYELALVAEMAPHSKRELRQRHTMTMLLRRWQQQDVLPTEPQFPLVCSQHVLASFMCTGTHAACTSGADTAGRPRLRLPRAAIEVCGFTEPGAWPPPPLPLCTSRDGVLSACLLRPGTSWVVVHQLCSGAPVHPEPFTETSRASFGAAGLQAMQVVAANKIRAYRQVLSRP